MLLERIKFLKFKIGFVTMLLDNCGVVAKENYNTFDFRLKGEQISLSHYVIELPNFLKNGDDAKKKEKEKKIKYSIHFYTFDR